MIPTRCNDPSRLFVGIDVSWWCNVAFFIACKATDDPVTHAPKMRPLLCGWLAELLRPPSPAYVAGFLDSVVKTWRHLATEHLPENLQYKAGRTKKPPEFHAEVRDFIKILQLHRIPCYVAEGWEADDVAATVVRQVVTTGLDVALVTLDHDWRALVQDDPAVYCWSYGRAGASEIGPAELLADVKKHGVSPRLVPHMTALCGDSDNIGGVDGIGPPKARLALERWGSVEGVLAAPPGDVPAIEARVATAEKARNKSVKSLGKPCPDGVDPLAMSIAASHELEAARLDAYAEKYRSMIAANRDAVELGLTLATLDPYAPLSPPFDLAACAVGGFDVASLSRIYAGLGFSVMADDVAGATAPKSTEAA